MAIQAPIRHPELKSESQGGVLLPGHRWGILKWPSGPTNTFERYPNFRCWHWFFFGLIGQGGMVPILLAFGGTAGGFATALWGLVLETTAERNLGMVSGMLNPAPFLGVAAMQTMTGALLDRVGWVDGNYPPEAYTDAFAACLLVMLGCLLLCAGLRKRLYRPS